MLRVNTTRPWMISSIWCYHSRGLEYCNSWNIDARQLAIHACTLTTYTFVSDIAIFVLKRDVKLQLTNWRPILLLLLLASWLLPAGQWNCCRIVNDTLFWRVTLISKLQSTSNLDHFCARYLPCSCVKSHDDLISDHRVDSAVPYSFICPVACRPITRLLNWFYDHWLEGYVVSYERYSWDEYILTHVMSIILPK